MGNSWRVGDEMGGMSRRAADPWRAPGGRRVALQRRDLGVLEELLLRRAETLEYLHGRFFAGATRKRALNRLGELCAAGFVARHWVLLHGERQERSVYTLGPRAKPALALRSLAGEAFVGRRVEPMLRSGSIPHQIATNRVADQLGVALIAEHLLPAPGGGQRHRPDGVYLTADADDRGRREVFLEVDVGHYSRKRVIEKVAAFLNHRKGRAMLFVCPSSARRGAIIDTLRNWFGEDVFDVVELLTFGEIAAGVAPRTYGRTRAPLVPVGPGESPWTLI